MSDNRWPWWTPARWDLAVRLYTETTDAPADILAAINAVDPEAPAMEWKQVTSRMTLKRIPRHPDAHVAALKRRAQHPDDAAVVARLRAMAGDGATDEQIAAVVGCSSATVARMLRRNGIVKVKAGPSEAAQAALRAANEKRKANTDAMREQMAALSQAGMAPAEIATKMSQHIATVYRMLGQAGIKARPHPNAIVLHADRRPKPPVPAQTVEEFIAAGGRITRCPTVALLPTQARIPQADLEATRAYHAAQDIGWREQIRRSWAGKGRRV